MGAGEEGTDDLIVYYDGLTLGLTLSVDFLNESKQIIASAPLQFLQIGTGTFTTTVPFTNTAQSYKSYRYVRINNTALGVFNIDAIQATTYRPDSDNDGLTDDEELNTYNTDPLNADTDGDGLPDGWEVDNGFDPVATDNSADDPDNDGLDNLGEYNAGTDPNNADTDGDGLPDGWEVQYGFDPVTTNNTADAPDSDGLTNLEEYQHGTNPIVADTDGDGLDDGAELNIYNTDPLVADTDGDGMPDGWEVDNGLDPLDPNDAFADPDNDGLDNLGEYNAGTDPHNPDTDGDGLLDGEETSSGTDPTIFTYKYFLPIILK
jgi:hypothetical protein